MSNYKLIRKQETVALDHDGKYIFHLVIATH